MMNQTVARALAERSHREEYGRVETDLCNHIAEAREQRVGDEPANGLSAIQAGVVVFARTGGAEGDDYHSGNVEQHSQRSEEHTSELQSHSDLVCRLLLEKKKKKQKDKKKTKIT